MAPVGQWSGLSVCLLALVACANEGSDLGFGPAPTADISVFVYLDRDGSRSPNAIDTVYRGARIGLFLKASADTLQIGTTDLHGVARFRNLSLGEYTVAVVPSSIGDSIEVQKVDTNEVRLTASTGTADVLVRLGYPEFTIQEARQLPQDKRIWIRGKILAGVGSFSDTTSHVLDASGSLRLTRVTLRGGLVDNAPGDSVAVLGVTSVRAGQPTLDEASIGRVAFRPAPVPLTVTTAVAASANSGVLDAALVQIPEATISATETIGPDFKVVVSDGTGALVMILDGRHAFPRSEFETGRSLDARGVLVPDGLGAWVLKPRGPADVTLH
jgi:hypothetical protein